MCLFGFGCLLCCGGLGCVACRLGMSMYGWFDTVGLDIVTLRLCACCWIWLFGWLFGLLQLLIML